MTDAPLSKDRRAWAAFPSINEAPPIPAEQRSSNPLDSDDYYRGYADGLAAANETLRRMMDERATDETAACPHIGEGEPHLRTETHDIWICRRCGEHFSAKRVADKSKLVP